MRIEFNSVLSSMVRVTKSLVGTSLATKRGEGNQQTPFVVKALKKPTITDYPYIVVGLLAPTQNGYSSKDEYMDTDCNLNTEFDLTVSVYIDVHSSEDYGSLSIANDLRQRLLTSSGAQLVCAELENGVLLDVSDPSYNPFFLETHFEEVSRLVVDLTVGNIIVDTTENIETVEVAKQYQLNLA